MQIFATLDADLQPVELTGQTAALYWQLNDDGAYVRSDHQTGVADVRGWDADALALNRVQAVTIPDAPAGKVLASYALTVDEAGVITVAPTWADMPVPPRREIPKSDVTDRLDAIGKLAAAFTALQADPRAFGRWFAPNWPNVYFDDPELLALLNGIGCTPDEVAQVTA